MIKAMDHVMNSARSLRAEYPHFTGMYNMFDEAEVSRMQEWADDTSCCLLRALGQQAVPVHARGIEFFLEKCISIHKIILDMPPTVDAIDALERMHEAIGRLKEALRVLRGSGDSGMLYTFRRESCADF